VLGVLVMGLTVVLSFLAGLAFRTAFRGSSVVFYLAVAGLIMPSVVIGLGIGARFELCGLEHTWYSSALRAHLTWTLPFGTLTTTLSFVVILWCLLVVLTTQRRRTRAAAVPEQV
jgi:putative spermidine/putrescine transport system permease protein